ncbi:MAG TPA: hypothetical protein VEA38_00490, partial [Terriglobales bacterium]|nr:hypothetical protein [Terriglobales bacterium]
LAGAAEATVVLMAARPGNHELQSVEELDRFVQGIHSTNWRRVIGCCLLASLFAEAGAVERAIEVIRRPGDPERAGFYGPELVRMEGELRRRLDPRAEVGTYFERAIAMARRGELLSLELRASVSLARLWRDTGRGVEARRLLDSVYARFTEGFDTADLRAAKTLLGELG